MIAPHAPSAPLQVGLAPPRRHMRRGARLRSPASSAGRERAPRGGAFSTLRSTVDAGAARAGPRRHPSARRRIQPSARRRRWRWRRPTCSHRRRRRPRYVGHALRRAPPAPPPPLGRPSAALHRGAGPIAIDAHVSASVASWFAAPTPASATVPSLLVGAGAGASAGGRCRPAPNRHTRPWRRVVTTVAHTDEHTKSAPSSPVSFFKQAGLADRFGNFWGRCARSTRPASARRSAAGVPSVSSPGVVGHERQPVARGNMHEEYRPRCSAPTAAGAAERDPCSHGGAGREEQASGLDRAAAAHGYSCHQRGRRLTTARQRGRRMPPAPRAEQPRSPLSQLRREGAAILPNAPPTPPPWSASPCSHRRDAADARRRARTPSRSPSILRARLRLSFVSYED